MTLTQAAVKYKMSVDELRREMYAFAQSEGYDDQGNEHETLDSWVTRKKIISTGTDPHSINEY